MKLFCENVLRFLAVNFLRKISIVAVWQVYSRWLYLPLEIHENKLLLENKFFLILNLKCFIFFLQQNNFLQEKANSFLSGNLSLEN